MAHMQQIMAPQRAATHLKVAAYARISFETERSPKSLSLQISHYSTLIQSTPGWDYAGVFADSGISGTTTNRPQFQAMLASARAGEIDVILTKSISRFARNTVDLLEVVRELNSLGVEVRFEKENISTGTADGEFMLTLLASFAQAESEQLSANVKWQVRKRFEQGRANGFHMYGYTDSADATDVQIIEHEAAVIRRAYEAYLGKVSMEEFTAEITAEGILNREGIPFSPETPRSWLAREAYAGTLTLGRWHSKSLGEHAVANEGEAPMYRVENAIPAIISPGLFHQVQVERQRRRDAGSRANWSIPTTCFTSNIKCGMCGMSFSRSGKRSTNGQVNYIWICRTKRDGKKRTGGRTCTNKNIPEPTLQDLCAEVLGLDEFDPSIFEARIARIEMPTPNRAIFHFKDGTMVHRDWVSLQRQKAWNPQRRASWGEHQKTLWDQQRRDETAKRMRNQATPEWREAHAKKMKEWWANPDNAKHEGKRRLTQVEAAS